MSKRTRKANTLQATVDEMVKTNETTISNLPSYTFEHAVHSALNAATEEGSAEAEMVCALFNGELWTLAKLESYFGAAKSQRITRDGKQVNDSTIETRKTMEHGMLLSVPEYHAAVEAVSVAKTELRFTSKQDALAIAKAKIKIKKLEEPILATRQMLHRAFQSLYACRKEGYISVRIGDNGELLVMTADHEEKPFTASNVRKIGNDALKKANLIQTRAPRVTAGDNAANVSVKNLDATLSAVGRLIEDDSFNPPVESDNGAVDKNTLAETALRIAYKLTADDVANNDGLRDTVSQIIVELQRAMGVKATAKGKAKAA